MKLSRDFTTANEENIKTASKFLYSPRAGGASPRRGFTLIELLVVIAIIGILSSVVLASLNSARQKGKDASITSQISSIRAAAELYATTNNSYGATVTNCTSGIFTDSTTNIKSIIASLQSAAGGTANVDCGGSATAWSVAAKLTGQGTAKYICVDSAGYVGSIKKSTSTGTYYNALVGTNGAHTAIGKTVCN